MRMRDELGVFYQDEAFAVLFPSRGQPAESPWRLTLVLVLQYSEGLSNEQAATAVRGRIDWKYALSLELSAWPRRTWSPCSRRPPSMWCTLPIG
jgi:transposase